MARHSHLASEEIVASSIPLKLESDKIIAAVAPANDRVSALESPTNKGNVDLAALKFATVVKDLMAMTLLEIRELLQEVNRRFC